MGTGLCVALDAMYNCLPICLPPPPGRPLEDGMQDLEPEDALDEQLKREWASLALRGLQVSKSEM